MIKVPSYLDFVTKLVSILGIGFDEDTMTTDKCRINEKRDFNTQSDIYTESYLPKIVNILSGGNEKNKKAVKCFLNIIESSIRYLNDKNYYTIASRKRGLWALFSFYFVPKLACMISIYSNELNIPKYLVDNCFMLPIKKSNEIVLPTERLKKYLKTKIINIDFIDDYLDQLNKNEIPRHQTKNRIINKIKENNFSLNDINEIDNIINCAIFSNHIYYELSKLFNENRAFELIEYFIIFFDCCNESYINKDIIFEKSSIFKKFIYYNMGFIESELYYLSNPFNDNFKIEKCNYREDLFHDFDLYLRESTFLEKDVLESIDFSTGIFKRSLDYNDDENIENEHSKIINLLKLLDYMFSNPKNVLLEDDINTIFNEIKVHKYFKNYKHEFLYYEGLNFLAKNEYSDAKRKLEEALKECKKITAGKTIINIAKIIIILRLLTENKIGFSSLNPEIKVIIDYQPEEDLIILNPNNDLTKKHNTIYVKKIINIIKEFNVEGYCHFNGIECSQYNPTLKMDEWAIDFFILYDSNDYLYENKEKKIELIIKKLMKGSDAKYPIKKPVIKILQYNLLMVMKNIHILYSFNLKKSSNSMERLINSPPEFLNLLTKTIENLMTDKDKQETDILGNTAENLNTLNIQTHCLF